MGAAAESIDSPQPAASDAGASNPQAERARARKTRQPRGLPSGTEGDSTSARLVAHSRREELSWQDFSGTAPDEPELVEGAANAASLDQGVNGTSSSSILKADARADEDEADRPATHRRVPSVLEPLARPSRRESDLDHQAVRDSSTDTVGSPSPTGGASLFRRRWSEGKCRDQVGDSWVPKSMCSRAGREFCRNRRMRVGILGDKFDLRWVALGRVMVGFRHTLVEQSQNSAAASTSAGLQARRGTVGGAGSGSCRPSLPEQAPPACGRAWRGRRRRTASASVTWIVSVPRSAWTSTRTVIDVRPIRTMLVSKRTTSPTSTGFLTRRD